MVFRAAEFAIGHPAMFEGMFPDNESSHSDPDYIYESVGEDEDGPLEFDSDANLSEDEFSHGKMEVDSEGDDDDDEDDDDVGSKADQEWIFRAKPIIPEFDTEFLPVDAPATDPLKEEEGFNNQGMQPLRLIQRHHEHIAGPGCVNTEGYLPHAISTEEMRNCHTVQCLLRKPRNWQPAAAADDMNFEKDSEYFLTGLADRMPTGLWDMEVEPARYGVGAGWQSQSAFYIETTQEELNQTGLPFHPTCFEIFIQASKQILGRVDIDALVQIRDRAALQENEFPVTHPDDVRDEQEQVWKHSAGREYLVANPVFIPDLAPIVAASIVSDDATFSIQNSPFPTRARLHDSTSAKDPFLSLPPELIHIIIWQLASPDIAALRLSSRAFTHLPISLWHHLLVKEIPALYEAWSSDPAPYYWSTLLATDLIKQKQEREKFFRNLEEPINIIRQDMPEIAEEWIKDALRWQWPEDPDRAEMLKLSPIRLPYERTNWYQLYRDLVVHWGKLKGLKNRVRIWDAVVQIIDAIQAFRGEEVSA
ncbi:hypothetical protein BJX68DRAFT_224201 [Aspergillus pseudodeflectus]|uniref:F-box domain-containing protein n=1 Tax=Aspergillus pseudodeflectus TaxID=176178 RepID=A0ABR4L962_9EURO